MKFILSILCVVMFAGCQYIGTIIPALAPAPNYPTGGLASIRPADAQLFAAHPDGAKMLAAPLPTAYTIPATSLMPVIYQEAQDCGPCNLAAIAYPATLQLLSPRATYVWSRQLASPSNWTPDKGTFAFENIKVAQTMGQPRIAAWPYPGVVNEIPTSPTVADAAAYELIPLLTPDRASMEAAIAANHPCCTFVYATQEWWYPVQCADGTWEVKDRTNASISIGGHFPTVVGYDHTRKMLDGTMGGMLIQNSWGVGWGKNGFAWISVAGWITANGDAGSRFTLLAKVPPVPPTPPTPPVPPGIAPIFTMHQAATEAGLPIGSTTTVAPGTPCLLMLMTMPKSLMMIQPGNLVVAGVATQVAPKVTTSYVITSQTTGGITTETITITVK